MHAIAWCWCSVRNDSASMATSADVAGIRVESVRRRRSVVIRCYNDQGLS